MRELKKIRREWLRWIADQNWDPDSALYKQADKISWWIGRLIDNIGFDAETWMRGNLTEQLAIMSEMLVQRRG